MSARPLHILVADDNRDAADALAFLLELDGHHLAVGYDGVDAVEAVDRQRPDLALLDIHMPRLDGLEAAARIRQRCGRDVTIVAITGVSDPAALAKVHAAGFDGVFSKPITTEQIQVVLTMAAAKAA